MAISHQELDELFNLVKFAPYAALGKEDTSKQRPRGYRKPNAEFVSYNKL